VELFELDGGGFVLDTPGFSSLEVSGITADELGGYFPEIKNCSQACRFRGCSHINEPGCAVKEMTDNGEMAQSRYESYKELFAQLSRVKEWERKQKGI
ncbi:MAG: ribosome small subunit-dependent GTPase A, partial [Clostridia bacterium]|nr:ribosome small subunit-dependent GTPase A [Clostridia bacterium]